MKVLVLGASGMLGAQVARFLRNQNIKVIGTSRNSDSSDSIRFDVGRHVLEDQVIDLETFDYVVNCIGAIPQRVKKEMDFRINEQLPCELSQIKKSYGLRIIQIGTDCVFSGKTGQYSESSEKDAVDPYGLSKIAGEEWSKGFLNLRTSIVGHDNGNVSLQSWLLSHAKNSEVFGYSNHYWNGITTYAFSRIVYAIIKFDLFKQGFFHIVPKNHVSKFELLTLIAKKYHRSDLAIYSVTKEATLNRTLVTNFDSFNNELWSLSGYDKIPTIEDLIHEGALKHHDIA